MCNAVIDSRSPFHLKAVAGGEIGGVLTSVSTYFWPYSSHLVSISREHKTHRVTEVFTVVTQILNSFFLSCETTELKH